MRRFRIGTFFEAVQVKAGFNIGVLTPASFRAIYKKTKGILNVKNS